MAAEQAGARLGPSSKRLLGQLPGRGWVRLPRLHGRGSAPCCGRVPGGARADNPDCMSSVDSTVLKRGRQTCSRMPRRVPASPSLSGFQAPADSRGDDSRRARLRRQLPRSVSCGDRGSECACKRTQGRSEETRGVSARAGDEWVAAPGVCSTTTDGRTCRDSTCKSRSMNGSERRSPRSARRAKRPAADV